MLERFGDMEIIKRLGNLMTMVPLGYPNGLCRFTCSLEWRGVHPGAVTWAAIFVKHLSWFLFAQGHLENEAASVINLG